MMASVFPLFVVHLGAVSVHVGAAQRRHGIGDGAACSPMMHEVMTGSSAGVQQRLNRQKEERGDGFFPE
jgi:hypothetical protein